MDTSNEDFNSKVIAAVEAKTQWFDTFLLPKTQEAYRLHITCVNNLFDALVKKSLITPDPYKKDKKISSVVPPDDSPFNDSDRSQQLGIRFSDYQSMLDFICNYMKFSVDQLNLDKIHKLTALNNTFNWSNLTPNSSKVNTRSLATCVNDLKPGAQPLQMAMLTDSLSKAKSSIAEINANLKALADFLRERYKADIRKNVIGNKSFDQSKMTDPAALQAEIKRLFAQGMPRRTFSAELVDEIVAEETSPTKVKLQNELLDKLQIAQQKASSKQNEVDTHEMLVEAIRFVATMYEQYDNIIEKINNNNTVLQSGHNSFKDKFLRLLRKMFGISEPEVEYNITIVDHTTEQKHKEKLNYTEFVANLTKRSKYYSTIAVKHTPGFNRINAQQDAALLDFLNKQMAENSRLQVVLGALDEFFKANVDTLERSKIKGIKVELATLKNILIKANQYRAEYTSLVEEKEQMKKLGISV